MDHMNSRKTSSAIFSRNRAKGGEVAGNLRPGLTLLEVLVCIGIVGILIGLLLAAVQPIRTAATRIRCSNNIRQLNLATQNYASVHAGRLPNLAASARGQNEYAPLFTALLPYIEQDILFSHITDQSYMLPTESFRVTAYLCPGDPTLGLVADDSAAANPFASYAGNGQVFRGSPNFNATFRDGTSNTILFAEHYSSQCQGVVFLWTIKQGTVVIDQNGLPLGSHRPSFADGGPNFPPDDSSMDIYPITSGQPPVSVGSEPLTFQIRPPLLECNGRIPNTAHSSMPVGMADGSVRSLNSSMRPSIYWALTTPMRGEIVGDW
jgi:prepilin-type N-terminal cleavage/methylation domain-containing protein